MFSVYTSCIYICIAIDIRLLVIDIILVSTIAQNCSFRNMLILFGNDSSIVVFDYLINVYCTTIAYFHVVNK